ncbi:MAG: Gp37 family protein [Desulfovibrionaceae bacterium]
MIEAIETELVAVLAAALPDLAVQPFPDNPDNYRLTHPSGAVLVGYGGGRFGGPSVLAGAAQTQYLEYQLVVKTRSLRTHVGAYAVLSAIRLAVSNRGIKGARFYPTRERFEDVSNGVWTYTAVYAADVPWVSQVQLPDDVAMALAAAKISLRDPDGEIITAER